MSRSSTLPVDAVQAVGGTYSKRNGRWVFSFAPEVRVAANVRGGNVPAHVQVDEVVPAAGPSQVGEFVHPTTGQRLRAASIPSCLRIPVAARQSGMGDAEDAQHKANAASTAVSVALGVGGPNAPAWLIYLLPKVVDGKPVVSIGAAADRTTREQAAKSIPASLGATVVIDMLQPKAEGLEGMGQIGTAALIGASLIAVGGQVGSVFIAADAQKYAAKTQAKADIQIALAQQQSELKALEAQMAAQRAQLEAARAAEEQATIRTTQRAAATKEVAISYAPYVGIGAFGLAAVYLIMRK